MGKYGVHEPHDLEDDNRISSWVRHATDDELGDLLAINPSTPTRRPSTPTYYEEVSPTNTTFSSGSVFDAPNSPVDGWIEDVFCDDAPDKVPSNNVSRRLDGQKKSAKSQIYINTDHFNVKSHASYDPSHTITTDLEEETNLAETSVAVAIPHTDPDKPRPTWLTSCAQCIHAGLPCSRKAAACSRCRRKGQAALCLLHRRPYPEEIIKPDAPWSTTLILLRLKDEDEDTWRKKLRLNDKLHKKWLFENDYRNWVLPSVESPRSGYRSNRIRAAKAYPGEGRGEGKDIFSYQELCVVMND